MNMCFINKNQQEFFNYMYPKDHISKEFFESSKLFKNSMSPLEKAEYIINFLESKYLLITPIVLKDVFNIIGVDEGFKDSEYLDLMYSIFGKESLNLRNWRERAIFKNFLTNEKDIQQINDEEKVKTDFENMMNERRKKSMNKEESLDELFAINKNKEIIKESKSEDKKVLLA